MLASLRIGKEHAHGQFGLIVGLIGKRDRHLELHRLAAGFWLVLVHEFLGLHHIEENNPVVIIPPIRTTHHQSPHSAGLHVHLFTVVVKPRGPHQFIR